MDYLLLQMLNGVQLGLLMFLLAAGLTLTFGIMDLVNLAHGSLYMMGAYIAWTLIGWTDSFLLGALLALPATFLLGIVVEATVMRRLYGRDHLDQVLATFGLILFFNELVRAVWGPAGKSIAVPGFLARTVEILPGVPYPAYRFAIIVAGAAVAALLAWLVARTRLGMLIRAGASNRRMIGALGVNIELLFSLVFGLGAVFAGLAGLMAAPLSSVKIGMGDDIMIVGYGGMVSFGHAMFFGIGGYAVGILAHHGIASGWIQWPAGIAAAALWAAVIGALSLRTRGLYFIMITLAFAQFVYYLGAGLEAYGGDDGLNISRSRFAGLLDLRDKASFYWLCFALLCGTLWFCSRFANSRFGLVIRGAKSNDLRMTALGFPVFRYRLAAVVLSVAFR